VKILIAGGGIGGLCLAQGLMKIGIDFLVFERDSLDTSRKQGYRLKIDADGDSALHACLPYCLYQLFRATTNSPGQPPMGAFDSNLNLIYRLPDPPPGAPPHVAIDRQVLRQILLSGLGDRFEGGRKVVRAESSADGAEVELETGEKFEGELVVAADGRDSTLRKSILPSAAVHDLQMTCVYGKTPLSALAEEDLPSELRRGFLPILGEDRITLGMGLYRSQTSLAEAWAKYAPDVLCPEVKPYVMWVLVFPNSVRQSRDLRKEVMRLTDNWETRLRLLLSMADPTSLAETQMCSSARLEPWPSSRITFLGDSIHCMTPAGGIGANTAMRDASNLWSILGQVNLGAFSMNEGIVQYENRMRDYGFEAVAKSLAAARALYRVTWEGANECL
jgi:salicylate hydroxylase